MLAVGWYLRNSLIQRFSNPVLAGYGLTITDISLDALAADNARISRLALLHDSGTTIAIDDLVLPIGVSPARAKTYAAGRVVIVLAAEEAAAPRSLARSLDQLLALPYEQPGTQIAIGELQVDNLPTLHEVRWVSSSDRQAIAARTASLQGSVIIVGPIEDRYDVTAILGTADSSGVTETINATVQRLGSDYAVDADLAIDLGRYSTYLRPYDLLPDFLGGLSGAGNLHVSMNVASEPSLPSDVEATFTPSSELRFELAEPGSAGAIVVVESAAPLELSATVPATQWTARQAAASLVVTYDEWRDIPVSMSQLACRSGPACSMRTRIRMQNATLPFGRFGGIDWSASQSVLFDATGTRVEFSPQALLEVTDADVSGYRVDGLTGTLTSGATLTVDDTGWKYAAKEAAMQVRSFRPDAETAAAAMLTLRQINVTEIDDEQSAMLSFSAPDATVRWREQRLSLPAFSGSLDRRASDLAISLTTTGSAEPAKLEVSHRLDTQSGRLSLTGANVSFASQPLSRRISPWPSALELVAGSVTSDLQLSWQNVAGETEVSGESTLWLNALAGAWQETAFTGLSSGLRILYSTAGGLDPQPATVSVGLVDFGIPVTNISADYAVHAEPLSVDVSRLRMQAFGGTVTADPFSFHTESGPNTLTLHAESLDLRKVLSMEDFEAIEVSGTIGAVLPVTVEGDTVRVSQGRLTGDPPGGVIRYKAAVPVGKPDGSAVDTVTRALSHFRYETLTSDVEYKENGDLVLKMRLTGRNPDMEGNRPIVLNLGVENNVPQMLRSLQAARSVEDILEKRLAK